jgi:transcriptional regulator with XRE-family HTH domain
MIDWSKPDVEKEYLFFREMLGRMSEIDRDLDKRAEPFLLMPVRGPGLKEMRGALQISAEELARRLGVTRSVYSKFEDNASSAKISIENLKKCAEALGCELVYGLRHKSRKLPSRVIFDQIVPFTEGRRTWRLWSQVQDKFRNGSFRQKLGWSRKRTKI